MHMYVGLARARLHPGCSRHERGAQASLIRAAAPCTEQSVHWTVVVKLTGYMLTKHNCGSLGQVSLPCLWRTHCTSGPTVDCSASVVPLGHTHSTVLMTFAYAQTLYAAVAADSLWTDRRMQ